MSRACEMRRYRCQKVITSSRPQPPNQWIGGPPVAAECKAALAQLLGDGVTAADVGFVAWASDGINQVGGAVAFAPGDNVVIGDLEFPSVALPWLRLRNRGVEVRVVRQREWDIPTWALLDAVDGRTRLLALSHVSFLNSLRHDVDAIGAALAGTSTLFLDATQSLGVMPLHAAAADFVVSSTYKWLLGTHGLGVLYWNRARRPDVQPGCSRGRRSDRVAEHPGQSGHRSGPPSPSLSAPPNSGSPSQS